MGGVAGAWGDRLMSRILHINRPTESPENPKSQLSNPPAQGATRTSRTNRPALLSGPYPAHPSPR